MKFLSCLVVSSIFLGGCTPPIYRADVQTSPINGKPLPAPLLARIAERRPASPVKGVMNGEAVVAEYIPGDSAACGTALITYQNLTHAETWKICSGGRILRAEGESEGLPKGSEFRAVRHAVSQGAWKLGRAQAVYADYEIFAATVGKPPEANHCLIVENTVLQNERTVDIAHERVCGE